MISTRTTPSRLAIRSLVLAAALGVAPAVAASAPASAAPYCGITWGSLAKSSSRMVTGPVTNVRAGRHSCYDRLVVDLKGRASGYSVRYVTNVFTEGQGAVVPLRGGAKLLVVVRAPAYDSNTGTASYTPRNPREVVPVTGYSTFRQVAWAGSFEGQTSLGLGVRARLPFRVFTIQDATSSRLVIDVAHRW
jgi:hypothetical protein